MTRIKFIARSPSSATNAQKASRLKDDPKKLRMRAEELELKSARLANEADELIARAAQIESTLGAPS
jgi:hypothetical protein